MSALLIPHDKWLTGDWKRAAEFWRLNWNTGEIARALSVDESEVYNRLDAIKQLARGK